MSKFSKASASDGSIKKLRRDILAECLLYETVRLILTVESVASVLIVS